MYALVSGFAFIGDVSYIPLILPNDNTLERQYGSNLYCSLVWFKGQKGLSPSFGAEEGEKDDKEKKVDGKDRPGHE